MQKISHSIDIAFAFVLFMLFCFSAGMIITMGVNSYARSMTLMDENFTSITASSYIKQKIKQNDRSGAVTIGEIDGVQVITLSKSIKQTLVRTYIYVHEGSLRELSLYADTQPELSAGHEVVSTKAMRAEVIKDGLFKITLIFEDIPEQIIYINTHSANNGRDTIG